MANRPSACPFCQSQNVRIIESHSYYQVACQHCLSLGPEQSLISQAVFSWNQLAHKHSQQVEQQDCLKQLIGELDQLEDSLAKQMLD